MARLKIRQPKVEIKIFQISSVEKKEARLKNENKVENKMFPNILLIIAYSHDYRVGGLPKK